MPELPEVETIKCQLKNELTGKRIKKIWSRPASLIFRDFPAKNNLPKAIAGKKVLDVDRRGKYILIEFEGNLFLVFHLGMSGNLLLRAKNATMDRHCHLEVFFNSFKLSLRDPRMFGRVVLFPRRDFSSLPGLANLGPEPLSKNFNAVWLAEKLHSRKAPIKSVLLNQKIAAGIGNIYSDEACYLARISPLKPASKLKSDEINRLVKAVKRVLKEAIRAMGCTFRDYKTSEGLLGDYHPRVYGREGRICQRCRGKIIKIRIGGRSSFYCPHCQR